MYFFWKDPVQKTANAALYHPWKSTVRKHHRKSLLQDQWSDQLVRGKVELILIQQAGGRFVFLDDATLYNSRAYREYYVIWFFNSVWNDLLLSLPISPLPLENGREPWFIAESNIPPCAFSFDSLCTLHRRSFKITTSACQISEAYVHFSHNVTTKTKAKQ